MVNFFNRIYTSIPPDNPKGRILGKVRIYSLLRFLLRNIANIVIPLYYVITSNSSTHRLQKQEKGDISTQMLIVSLTTFPVRIKKVWLVVETLLRQKKKPNKIILWLSKDQFNGFNGLPRILKKQTKRGLEIRFVNGDIRSHKKYYYAMQEYPEDLIITVDDDIFYRDDLIQVMERYHKQKPLNIIAFFCLNIKRSDGQLCPYNSWSYTLEDQESISELFFGSGGGTLYPPRALYNDILNINLFMKLTPLADDIWLNTMSRLNKTPIQFACIINYLPLPIIFKKNKTLATHNVSENMNDKQITNVRDYYIETYNINPFDEINN